MKWSPSLVRIPVPGAASAIASFEALLPMIMMLIRYCRFPEIDKLIMGHCAN